MYPEDIDSITTFSICIVRDNWIGNPLSNHGQYGLLFTYGMPYNNKPGTMAFQLLYSWVNNGTSTIKSRIRWNSIWQSWVTLSN